VLELGAARATTRRGWGLAAPGAAARCGHGCSPRV